MEDNLPWKTLSWQSQHRTCAVAVCKTPHPPETSLHKFPKDPEIRKKWVAACKRKDNFKVDSAIVCSRHFTADCFDRDLRSELLEKKRGRILKGGSIPTINLLPAPGSSQVPPPPPKASAREERVQKREQKVLAKELITGAGDAGAFAEQGRGETRGEKSAKGATSDPAAETPEGDLSPAEADGGDVTAHDGDDDVVQDVPLQKAEEKKWISTSSQASVSLQDKQTQCDHGAEIKTLRKRIKALQMQLDREKRKKNPQKCLSAREKKLVAQQVLSKTPLTQQQIKMFLTGSKKTHWQPEDIVVGLTLRALSRKSYEFLRRKGILPLPSLTTIRRYIRSFECKPGIQQNILHGKVLFRGTNVVSAPPYLHYNEKKRNSFSSSSSVSAPYCVLYNENRRKKVTAPLPHLLRTVLYIQCNEKTKGGKIISAPPQQLGFSS